MAQVKMMTSFVQSTSFYSQKKKKKDPSNKPILLVPQFGQLRTGGNQVGSMKFSFPTSSFTPFILPTRKAILGSVSGSLDHHVSTLYITIYSFFHLMAWVEILPKGPVLKIWSQDFGTSGKW